MESTVMSLLRTTVILAFVLGLPAIALFGVPKEVCVLLESDLLPWNRASRPMDENHQNATDPSIPASSDNNFDSHDHDHQPSFFARTASTHAEYERETGEDAGSRIALASAEARVLHRPVFRPLGDEKSEIVRHLPTVDMTGQSQRGPHSDASVVAQIEARLRQLGALNYQLQQQSGGGSYRFVCLCANDRGEQRTFEATSEDRLQAMQTVLDQVTKWSNEDAFRFFGSFQR